jgi:EmrB/QacA subfamily drug resistance transporter
MTGDGKLGMIGAGSVKRRDAGVDRRVVLLVASMASFLTPFMGSSINIALPSIGAEFRSDAVTLSWISTVYFLAAAVFLVPFGRLADIHGRRKVFLSGIVGYTVVSLLCGLSRSESMLIVLRGLQGFTDAMIFGTGTAIVTTVYPPRERGKALGVTVACVYAGGSLGPFIGGLLTQYAGWRSIFFLTAILGLAAAALTLWKMRGEWAEAAGQKMDVVGSVLYGVSLLGVMYGFRLLPSLSGLWLILGGGVALVGFALRQARVSYPVLDVALFRGNPTFAFSNLAALINYAATFALTFLLSLFLQYVKGLTPQAAGMLMLSQPVVMAVTSPFAGRLSDRVQPRIVATTGMALSTAGLIALSFIGAGAPLALIVCILMVCGLGFGLFSSPNTSAIMGSVERKHYAVASATTGVMRLIGQMLSMGIAALIIAMRVGEVEITPAQHPAFLAAFRIGFLVFSALCIAGMFASFARGNVKREAPSEEEAGNVSL